MRLGTAAWESVLSLIQLVQYHRYSIFRYPDGHEERGQTTESDVAFDMGRTLQHDGLHWKAVESQQVGDDPNRLAVVFVPDG